MTGMTQDASVTLGAVTLKNPVIAGPAEHLIEAAGIRRAIESGVGAVVIKSANEADRRQGPAPGGRVHAVRRALAPGALDARRATRSATHGLPLRPLADPVRRLAATRPSELDRIARDHGCLLVASLILADLDAALGMARQRRGRRPAGAGVQHRRARTPARPSPATSARRSTPARIAELVSTRCARTVKLPLWVKLTGQSDRVPDLAAAAFDAGAEAVIMAGRLLGFIPDLDTLRAHLRHQPGRRRVLEPAAHLPVAGDDPQEGARRPAAPRSASTARRPARTSPASCSPAPRRSRSPRRSWSTASSCCPARWQTSRRSWTRGTWTPELSSASRQISTSCSRPCRPAPGIGATTSRPTA